MKKNFVPQKDIDRVVDGLNKYFLHMMQTKTFNPIEMKELMEPIFTEAGYRQTELTTATSPNILFTAGFAVGDFIRNSGALRELRRIYPDSHITMLVYDRASNLVECCPYIDDLIIDGRRCDQKNFFSLYQWNLDISKKLLFHRFDMVFYLSDYPSHILMAYMGGAKKIFSFKANSNKHYAEIFGDKIYAPMLFEVPAPNPKINDPNNFSRSFSILDSIFQYPIKNREGEVWLSAMDRAFARDILSIDISNGRKIYIICMGGTKMSKMWPPQNYARLAQMIVEREPNVRFVLTGGGDIDGWSANVFKQSVDEKFFAEHVIDLTNKATYRQSGAVIALADMYIGNDTGTMHMAAAVKTPVLNPNCYSADMPFEGSMPSICYPYHVPSVTVFVKHPLPECRDSKDLYGCIMFDRPHCITQITVETVFDGYNKLKERIAQNNIEPLFIS